MSVDKKSNCATVVHYKAQSFCFFSLSYWDNDDLSIIGSIAWIIIYDFGCASRNSAHIKIHFQFES